MTGQAAAAIEVEIVVQGIRNHRGHLLVAVFDAPAGFPSDPTHALEAVQARPEVPQMRLRFRLPPDRPLAVGVLHDEDDDGRMTTNWLGMPIEGYGVSGSPRFRFGPPRFEECLVRPQPGEPVVVTINYP